MSKIGVEMKGFQAQPAAREEPLPEGQAARSLYGVPAQPGRSGLMTALIVVILGIAAAAAGYLAIAGLPGNG